MKIHDRVEIVKAVEEFLFTSLDAEQVINVTQKSTNVWDVLIKWPAQDRGYYHEGMHESDVDNVDSYDMYRVNMATLVVECLTVCDEDSVAAEDAWIGMNGGGPTIRS
jgi:hypothetical protein